MFFLELYHAEQFLRVCSDAILRLGLDFGPFGESLTSDLINLILEQCDLFKKRSLFEMSVSSIHPWKVWKLFLK